MNYKVREYLIDLSAQKQTIGYQRLSDACHLGLDMQASEYDRAEIGKILGEISTFEHNNGRPLISALVVHEGTDHEGEGFYKLAQQLGFGPWKSLRDRAFDAEQINLCFEFWGNPENYDNYKSIS